MLFIVQVGHASLIKCTHTHVLRVGQSPYICTVYDRMYGNFLANNTVYTPYIPVNIGFRTALHVPGADRRSGWTNRTRKKPASCCVSGAGL